MELAMIGLGRMGGNMASRLLRGGHRVVAWNRSPEPVRAVVAEGAVGATLPEDV
jgi:6-phosphogluconate dehydrogenase